MTRSPRHSRAPTWYSSLPVWAAVPVPVRLPIVAEVAHDMGILTVGIVTKPFLFEGARRMSQAELGIAALRENVDALLVIPNERLKLISEEKITLLNAFSQADLVLKKGVQSISDLINIPGIINLDFADVVSIMKGAGLCSHGHRLRHRQGQGRSGSQDGDFLASAGNFH